MAGERELQKEQEAPLEEIQAYQPQVDGARVAYYVQHIRALNSQFASWIQQQMKDYPDVLWKEGVQDYLCHVSTIMVKFKDVATLHKENQNKPIAEAQAAPIFGISSSSISTHSSSGFPIVNVCSQGIPTCMSTDNGDAFVEDGEKPDGLDSPSLKRVDEPGIESVYETKCKFYIKGEVDSDIPWKDMGMANLILKRKEGARKGSQEAKPTIVIRNDVGRILLNALLYASMKITVQKKSVYGIFHSVEYPQGQTYLIRLKTEDDAQDLAEAITSNAPAAG